MTGFEPQTSVIGSDRSTNCDTTNAQALPFITIGFAAFSLL